MADGVISALLLALQVVLVTCSQQTTQVQLSPSPPTEAPPSLPPLLVQPSGAPSIETTTALTSVEANSTSNSTESEQPTCFFEPASACENTTQHKPCRTLPSVPGSVLCCNIGSPSVINRALRSVNISLKDIERLHLRNVTTKVLDVGANVWNELVSLEHLAITDGTVQIFQGRLKSPHVNCLNLSANVLTQLPTLNVSVDHIWIDLFGNNRVTCDSIREFKSHLKNSSSANRMTTKVQFAHDDQTYCLTSQSYNWFKSTERVSLAQAEATSSLDEDCPTFSTCSCRCEIARTEQRGKGTAINSVKVDCSGCNLTELPPRLPPHTVILDVSDNQIWNLTALSLNPYYSEIRLFHADNNSISSIDILEGSTFIQHFVLLSLRSNNISAVPIYILSNVFDRSGEARISLGKNRLKCDCSTAQTVKVWLITHKKYIQDYMEVMCANMPERVTELDQNKICAVQSDWTDYIYYIIAGEVALLIMLIAKVSYDYWVFKTAGYLPWPASKMPKLPCDWVFE